MLLLILAHLPAKVVSRNACFDTRDDASLILLARTFHDLHHSRNAHLLRLGELGEDSIEHRGGRRAGGFLGGLSGQVDIFGQLVCALCGVLSRIVGNDES